MNRTVELLEPRRLLAVTGLPFKLGSGAFDEGSKIVAIDGGYIVAGLFSGTVDFDPTAGVTNLTSVGDSDIYVARYTSASKLVWVKQIGGDGMKGKLDKEDRFVDIAADPARAGGDFVNGFSDAPLDAGEYVNALKVDSSNNVYIGGDFIDSVDFDPGRGTHVLKTFDNNYYDGYVLKLSASGAFQWVTAMQGDFTDTVQALAIDPATNSVYATGLFSRDVPITIKGQQFNLHAQGRADGYLMQLLPGNGSIQWLNQFGSDDTDRSERESGNDLAIDGSSNIYVAGAFSGDARFTSIGADDTSVSGDKLTDGFLAKYASTGKLRSVQTYVGKGYDGLTQVVVDSSGSVYVAGYYEGDHFDADPGPADLNLEASLDSSSQNHYPGAFVEKLAKGAVQWVQNIDGTNTTFLSGLAVSGTGSLYAIGSFYGTESFGSGTAQIESVHGTGHFKDPNDTGRDDSYDMYLLQIDAANGKIDEYKTFGSTGDDYGSGLSIAADGSVLTTGRFRFDVDFDPSTAVRTIHGIGLADAFIVGFSPDLELLP